MNTCPRPTTELGVKIKVNVGDGEPIESALRRFKLGPLDRTSSQAILRKLCRKEEAQDQGGTHAKEVRTHATQAHGQANLSGKHNTNPGSEAMVSIHPIRILINK